VDQAISYGAGYEDGWRCRTPRCSDTEYMAGYWCGRDDSKRDENHWERGYDDGYENEPLESDYPAYRQGWVDGSYDTMCKRSEIEWGWGVQGIMERSGNY
jgi:hypothetical protein